MKCVKILSVSFLAFLEEEEFPWEAFHILGNWRAAGAAEARLLQRALRPFLMLLISNLLSGRKEGGQNWSCGLPTLLKSFAELVQSSASMCRMLMLNSSQREERFCFPLRGPQNGRKARFLCGRILGSQLVERSSFLSQQVRRGNASDTGRILSK